MQMNYKLPPTIVSETDGRWAAALRTELPRGAALVETRSLSELWSLLPGCQNSTVILELKPGKEAQLLAALMRIARKYPRVISIVVAHRKLSSWEDVVREAGALHFIAAPRRLPEVAEIVRRRCSSLSAYNADGGEEAQLIEERIFATLPWAE